MNRFSPYYTYILVATLFFVIGIPSADAASLRLNPSTGVYTVAKVFTASVVINTEGKAINAADGQLSFNPRELKVIAISRASSIFNLWTEEPTFSNTTGHVSFGGGSPTGYTGSSGNIVTITFSAIAAGTPKVSFKSGSILAADGLGTNVLTSMSGATYTVSAPTETPEPEYIAPPNTPRAPVIESSTHSDQTKWYRERTAILTWNVPSGITALRTALDASPSTIPTKVYDEPITSKTLEDLEQGVSYFHIQFKNKEGWGKVAHYRLAIDTESPKNFTVSIPDIQDEEVSGTKLIFTFEDISPVKNYKIQIDGGEPFIYEDKDLTASYITDVLSPGYHTVVVEAFDDAHNSSIASVSFTVQAFEKPKFTEYAERINTGVIPAFKGITVPHARVAVIVQSVNGNTSVKNVLESGDMDFSIVADDTGAFTFIPDSSFEQGVYRLVAIAKDKSGRLSEPSDEIRVVVEAPGYIAIGTFMVSLLSIIVPLISLLLILIIGTWYVLFKFSRWRRTIRKETLDVEEKLAVEFKSIIQNLDKNINILKKSRKGKLTVAESALIEEMQSGLKDAQTRIQKEVSDIEDIIK